MNAPALVTPSHWLLMIVAAALAFAGSYSPDSGKGSRSLRPVIQLIPFLMLGGLFAFLELPPRYVGSALVLVLAGRFLGFALSAEKTNKGGKSADN